MTVAPAESNIDKLPDDVLTEVMLRVPRPADLVHAAAVSKRWRRVIARREFLGNYRKRHKSKSSPFFGLYIPRNFGGLPSFEKADSIQSANSADLDLQRAAAMAFSLDGLESDPEWRLLDCYNGRLLLAKGNKSLEVYNPLSRERIPVALPKDGILPDNFSACLLHGHGDEVSSFRVVSVQHERLRRIRAVEYDSRWESWKDHPWETLKMNIHGTQQVEVMHAGNLVFCKYTAASLLLLDTSKMEFSALPLPADNNHKNYAIGEMEDGVCCFASVDSVGIWNKIHLRLWKLEKLEWKLEKGMLVEQVLGEQGLNEHAVLRGMYYRVRAVTNGIALLCLISREHQLSFVVDLRTFGVKDKFEFKDIAFPMQIPWPPTFSNAIEGLGIQDPAASVPTTTASEECFEGESPDIRERQHIWGPIQVYIKSQRCFEDWDGSEGESPGSCKSDTVSQLCGILAANDTFSEHIIIVGIFAGVIGSSLCIDHADSSTYMGGFIAFSHLCLEGCSCRLAFRAWASPWVLELDLGDM